MDGFLDIHLVNEDVVSFELSSVTIIPEPSSALLTGLGLMLLACRRRRLARISR